MSGTGGRRAGRGLAGWRGLGVFWAVVLLALGGGAVVLQRLGPPAPEVIIARSHRPAAVAPAGESKAPRSAPRVAAGKPPAPPSAVSRVTGSGGAVSSGASAMASAPPAGPPAAAAAAAEAAPRVAIGTAVVVPVAPPAPALAEPADGFPGSVLPRIAADGRTPMRAYRAAFDRSNRLPRVGLILAGIGMDAAASAQAIARLPAAVTLAVSPYAADPTPLLAAARRTGHEYLLSLPMEPQSFPLNDPGPQALRTGATAAANLHQLDWALLRFAGYVGVTGALGPHLRGERFAASAEEMDPVLRDLAGRGLLYVDPRPGAAPPPFVTGRTVDVVIDRTADAAAIDAALARLDRIAARKGSALGLASAPVPVTLARLAAWSHRLAAAGLVLAPVSALVSPSLPPAGPAPAAKPGGEVAK